MSASKISKRPGNFKLLGRYSYFVPGVAELFILLAFFLLGALLGNIVTAVFSFVAGSDAAMEYGTVIAYPLMFIPAMIYASAKSSRNSFTRQGLKMDSCHFGRIGGALAAVLVVFLVFSMAFCTDAVSALMPPMPEWLSDMLEGMTRGNLLLNILCVGVFAAFFEEWLCRGMVLRGLLGNNVRPGVAIPVSALFFALIHLNPWQAVPAFILGCVFGYVYYKTGSLKLTMLMHFANNTLAVILSNVDSLSGMENWMDVLSAKQYWPIFAGCLLLAILIIRKFSEIPVEKTSGNLDVVKPVFETLE